MDAFTAIALVGNILQFVVYARDVYKQVKEIRSSEKGISRKNQEIVWSASELHSILDSINAGTNSLDNSTATTAKRIRTLGIDCQRLAEDLKNDIENKAAKDRSNVFEATKSVLLGTSRLSKVEEKLRALNRMQEILFKYLLAHISNQQTGLEMAMMSLMEQNRKLEITRTDDIRRLKTDILAAIPSIELLQEKASLHQRDQSLQISSKLLDWCGKVNDLTKEQTIINSLRFDGMLHRQNEISDAHKDTFQWINDPSLHFRQWLESGEGIYWVTGDPGSGKSTLMKHLNNDLSTHQALMKWAGSRKLVKASFYFWFSGTVLQKTQDGLFRSLLFEIFRQCPSSIRTACPTRWTGDLAHRWDRQELVTTLKKLRLQSPLTRFCFFIDGLDEYRGDPSAQGGVGAASFVAEIIDVMNTLSTLPDVKLCLSSRPWHAFEKAYGKSETQKLYVNDENRNDIRLYIRDRLENADVFVHSQADRVDLQQLINSMVEDSRGVFLWVFLVAESLLRGLTNEDRPAELRRRLEETPKTLNEVFERMLGEVEEIYHEQAAQILQVAVHAVEPMYVVLYSFIGDDEHDALLAEIKPWSKDECIAKSKTAEVRLKVRCPDLIKIWTPRRLPETAQEMTTHHVDFLHRTVRDFLSLVDTQELLNRRLKQNFDPTEFLCNSLLTQIKAASVPGPGVWLHAAKYREGIRQLMDDITYYARELELRTQVPQTTLLDELQRVIACQMGDDDFVLDGISFTGLMVQKDLQLYVETRLPQALNGPGNPLLELALLPPFGGARYPTSMPSPRMVSLLLSHGAKPGQFGDKTTAIWDRYMLGVYESHKRSPEPVYQGSKEDQISIIQELLQHGADPKLRCLVGMSEPKVTVGKAKGISYPVYMDVLEMVQEIFQPEERVFIEALIREGRRGFFSNLGFLGALGWR
ncbi:Fc.00g092700.m01.CDS01 [Cosmosporella sp. VM-42]